MTKELIYLSEKLGQALAARHWHVATAESCTGGGVAAAITSVAGSSAWFGYGVVSYADRAKETLLGVLPGSLSTYGAVSEQVVREMAEGIMRASHADIAVAVSGIAGPTGGSIEKPVGTVWFAWAAAGKCLVSCRLFTGDRQCIQQQAVMCSLEGLLSLIDKNTV